MDITALLKDLGIHSEYWITTIRIVAVFLISGIIGWLAYLIAKKWLAKLVMKIAGRTESKWDDLLFDQKFFTRLGLLIAPIVIRIGTASIHWKHIGIVTDIISVWITFAALFLISAILDGVNRIYESYPISRDKPIRVFIQVIMIFLYCTAILVIVRIFTGESITGMLTALTAFAAIILLIFKDSILGFVAGIQLSANNMVRIGDWIVMPSSGADGSVLEINLTSVKVQNWDMTITTIPTYKLVSESFTNWRGMEESDGRRIKRHINIDFNSIHYLTDKEIDNLKKSVLLKDYIEDKLKELKAYNENRSTILDERRLTNIGTFREYLELWLSHNPDINLNMTHMVRQLQPGPTGVPLEIYCFSSRQQWIKFEQVQSDIFDHVFAVMGLFNLKTFQYSGDAAAAADQQQ